MRNKKIIVAFLILALLAASALIIMKMKGKGPGNEIIKEISPVTGKIQVVISTTASVLPKNRLEVKPPVNGRVESIQVKEGERVKIGQALAWMSSTERAALLDAAQGQGEATLKYWKEVYKPIQLLSPIAGEVIVATTQPGQAVTTTDAVVVLSDQLIVRAQVDETDIGKVKLGQEAVVSLDAYPDTKIKAAVEHIYYESQTVNNVTIYQVDLIPREAPAFFRSGMNASVDFIIQSKEGLLLIPLEAVYRENGDTYVLEKRGSSREPVKVPVKLGISDDKNIEVISGISADDRIIAKTLKYKLPKGASSGSNPFLPFRRR